MKYIKYIVLSCICLFSINAYSQVTIESNSSKSDTVDLGMCLVGDSLQTSFIVTNHNSSPVKIISSDPSFFIGKPVNYTDDDFREFFRISPNFPLIIQANDSKVVVIRYYATKDFITQPLGVKFALMKLGVFDADLATVPTISDMLCYKEFILKAKKTNLCIDTYNSKVSFDTVYINPFDTLRYTALYKNMYDSSNIITNEKFTYYNSNALIQEFAVRYDKN